MLKSLTWKFYNPLLAKDQLEREEDEEEDLAKEMFD
jgi:hypothetical protein